MLPPWASALPPGAQIVLLGLAEDGKKNVVPFGNKLALFVGRNGQVLSLNLHIASSVLILAPPQKPQLITSISCGFLALLRCQERCWLNLPAMHTCMTPVLLVSVLHREGCCTISVVLVREP